MVFLDFIASVMMKMRLSQRLEKLKTRLTGHFGSSISFNSLKNMKLNELRITNCSRKPEVSVERISLKNYRSLVCTFCYCMPCFSLIRNEMQPEIHSVEKCDFPQTYNSF